MQTAYGMRVVFWQLRFIVFHLLGFWNFAFVFLLCGTPLFAKDWTSQDQEILCGFQLARFWESYTSSVGSKKKVLVVHPHERYDFDKVAKAGTDEEIRESTNVHILAEPLDLVLRENGEKYYPHYLSESFADRWRFLSSKTGEFSPSRVPVFSKNQFEVVLCGGIINQCHRRSFWDLLDFAIKKKYSEFSVLVPLSAVYFQLGWGEFGDGYREYGIGNFPLLWQVPEPRRNSYTLRDIYRLRYRQTWGGRVGMYRLLDISSAESDESTIKDNLDRIFQTYFISGYTNKLLIDGVKVLPYFSVDQKYFKMRIELIRK